MHDARARRAGGDGFQSKGAARLSSSLLVSPRLSSGCGEWLPETIGASQAPLPAVRLLGERDGLGGACHGARPATSNPPKLGQDQEALIPGGSVADLLVRERLPAV